MLACRQRGKGKFVEASGRGVQATMNQLCPHQNINCSKNYKSPNTNNTKITKKKIIMLFSPYHHTLSSPLSLV